jgi:alpha-mannosidase
VSLILVCNSHIDPVWLWPWEEGLAEALATFRAAAGLCEEFEGFVFCHNEALLYRFVEQFEPALFEHIRALVGRGRWHIMGGWYVQPDCNLPSGESLVRQALAGKRYFLEKFGVEPTVASNLDSFGHSRGLVQILKKAGYDGYLFCRPDRQHLSLPADDFLWVGYDGSTVVAHRAADHYNSERGTARSKVERWLERHPDRADGLLLWGVGNHGGGPSREDLSALASLIAGAPGSQTGESAMALAEGPGVSPGTVRRQITHGRPEDYFDAIGKDAASLPRFAGELNPWAVGCYTSMATLKRAHRRLESAIYGAEKMLAGAAIQDLLEYPRRELQDATQDLLFCEFHDTLAGSSVSEVEEQALQRLGHALDITTRLRARAFFALLSGEPPAADGEYPVFVHNPHPFEIEDTIVCELQPPEPNFDTQVFLQPELVDPGGRAVPLQLEKESCNIQIDQRKRLVFRGRLAPSQVTRFTCRLRPVPRPQVSGARPVTGRLDLRTAGYELALDGATGLVSRHLVRGTEYLGPGAFRPLVVKDSADPWGMKVRSFRDVAGQFRLMSPATAAAFAGVSAPELAPVRIIEDGEVRKVVEALFEYGRSALCLRYKLPAEGSEIEVEARVYWMEKDRMLKLSLPTPFAGGRVRGQAAYGVEEHEREMEELVAQKWIAVMSRSGAHALTVINDATYGFDFAEGELRLSLLRSPAYAGHPVDEVTPIVRQDRFEPRIDQGEHRFRFWLNAGTAATRLCAVDREATAKHEAPLALCAWPRGGGAKARPAVLLSDEVVQLGAMKIAETGDRLILRLFEPAGEARATTITIPPLDLQFDVALGAFEIRTLAIDLKTRTVDETDLLERKVVRHG